MGGLTVAKHFELRLELRGDFANKDIFQKGDAAPRWPITAKTSSRGWSLSLPYF